jgi:diacylglycerol O-acyltransferase
MDELKESKQAVGAATLTAVNNLAPPTILAQASRLNFSTRLFNLLVTNVPGPQIPLYVLGRRLEDLYPVAFLPENHALAIAIMSYNGGLDYGLLGDYDAMSDIDLVADGIAAALAELLSAARDDGHGRRPEGPTEPNRVPSPAAMTNGAGDGRSAPRSAPGQPAPIVPVGHGRPTHGPAADMRAGVRAKRQRGARPARKRPDT